MLKRKFSRLGELGSMMVEALAMLGLISMVTPIVYKKAAERNMEIQDVNAASQMRNLIKGVDEYILDNYGKIVDGDIVRNDCPADEPDYKDFNSHSTGPYIEVDIRHFCDYLPFGFIETDGEGVGNVADNKVFDSDYKVVIKKVETETAMPDGEDPMKRAVLTGFVMATPKIGSDFPRIRASRISSMVGGNGGYIENNEAFGVQGLWGIADVSDELGLDNAENGSLLISSASPISHGGTNDDAVLYRRQQTRRQLNTMQTTLWMGLTEGEAEDIQHINQAVIVGTNLDKDNPNADDGTNKALWIKYGGGAFVDGVLGVAANRTDTPSFYVDLDGALRAAGNTENPINSKSIINTTDDTTPVGRFEIDKDGALKTSDGKFFVDKDGAIQAAVNGVGVDAEGNATSFANFTVDKDGNIVSKGSAEIEVDLTAKNRAVIGSKDYNINSALIDMDNEENYQLVVNGHAFIKGLLRVFHFKADNIDAGILRAGTDSVINKNSNTDYTLYVDKEKFAIGPLDNLDELGDARFTVIKDTADTSIKGGNLVVQLADETTKVLDVKTSQEYVYVSGLRAGDYSDGLFPLEVENDGAANITMRLKEPRSTIMGFDSNDGTIMDFNNDFSRIQKESASGESFGNITFRDDSSLIKTQASGDISSNIEVLGREILMDVTPTDSVNNFELIRKDSTASADLALRNSSSVKVFGDADAPVLYVDPEAIDAENTTNREAANSRGGVYIRRGVVDLESNHESDYIFPNFVDGKDKGYVRADMLISKGVDSALDRNEYFYTANDNITSDKQYDAFMVNPAYTSVMHDIKLTSRGGARLSDILPDFINKGIYLADNTYSERLGNWTAGMNYSVVNGKVESSKAEGAACAVGDYQCQTSPWLGIVPTPQCPPGYDKVIQVFPYGFNIAQAGAVAGKDRDDLYTFSDQDEQFPDPFAPEEDLPLPLYFQKNTWLKTRAMTIGERENLMGWYVLMGYVYPTGDYQGALNKFQTGNIISDNNYIWNLYPVLYRELEAYANVYCHFTRRDRAGAKAPRFDSNYVDVDYDQLDKFRSPKDKTKATNVNRLDDPNMNYKNPW